MRGVLGPLLGIADDLVRGDVVTNDRALAAPAVMAPVPLEDGLELSLLGPGGIIRTRCWHTVVGKGPRVTEVAREETLERATCELQGVRS